MGCGLSTATGDILKPIAKVAPPPLTQVVTQVVSNATPNVSTVSTKPTPNEAPRTDLPPLFVPALLTATETTEQEKVSPSEKCLPKSDENQSPRQQSGSSSPSLASVMSVLPNISNNGTSASRRRRWPHFTIDTSRSNTNKAVVSLCSALVGILEYPNGRDDNLPCDIYWFSVVPTDMKNTVKSCRSRVNKFPGMAELSKKVSLTHAISSMQKIFPEDYKFYPSSFFLPAHYDQLEKFWHDEIARRRQQNINGALYFIVKPDDGAQGTGIYLINDLSQIRDPSQKQLVQEYVADPFLMKDRLKFDFRVYGVIKSINPLSIYVSREGMVRFCTEKYQKPTPSNFENLFAHLTNYSLNKANFSYIHSLSLIDQANGSKRLLSTVFGQMAKSGLRTRKLWREIKIIIVKTVLAMLPELMIKYEHEFNGTTGPQCFQIIGFDIIVREDGTPVLLEVNAAPSLTIDHNPTTGIHMKSIVDELIKLPLVRDTLLLVTGQLPEPVRRESPNVNNSSSRSSDDLTALKTTRKPHLSEIFPNRYGHEAKHLLFVDRAVYIFMQFANLRMTTNISTSNLRRFVRDCRLEKYFSPDELDSQIADISHHYTGDANNNKGLPFHGFLDLLSLITKRRYPDKSLQVGLSELLNSCSHALRNKGVRSQRLRREEVDTKSGQRIYMLPSHAHIGKARSKSCEPIVTASHIRKADGNNNSVNASLPSISRK